jgi:sodium transport system ATP-binding protein
MIIVRDLRKRFGDVEAVSAVSFSAENGRITGLLGPNGAGKSTTLRMIASLLRADDGQILIDNIDIARQPIEARRRIGVLSHASGLYPHLTARENIRYFAALHGLSRSISWIGAQRDFLKVKD